MYKYGNVCRYAPVEIEDGRKLPTKQKEMLIFLTQSFIQAQIYISSREAELGTNILIRISIFMQRYEEDKTLRYHSTSMLVLIVFFPLLHIL